MKDKGLTELENKENTLVVYVKLDSSRPFNKKHNVITDYDIVEIQVYIPAISQWMELRNDATERVAQEVVESYIEQQNNGELVSE